jgi:1-acyl-sn-glycerol-3-phosphate acyltransferase
MRMCAYVPLRRGDKESIARMLDQSKEWLRRGMSILMFPEGTRSKDGLVQPFKHGAFTLALDTGASVVPVAVHGGHRLIPKHGLVFNHSVDLLIEVLDPIPSDGFSDVDSLAVESRRRICAALGQENAARDAAEAAVAAEATARSLRADSEPRCV